MTTIPYSQPMFKVKKTRTRGKPLNKKQKKQVKTLISKVQELKYKQFEFNGGVSQTGTIVGACDIAQGDGGSARDGDRIQYCGNTEVRLRVVNSSSIGADAFNNIRVIIFQWHPVSTPTIDDILADGPLGVFLTGYDHLSPNNHDTRQQYKILFDKNYSTTLGSTTEFPESFMYCRSYKLPLTKFSKFTQYSPPAGLQGTNRFYILFLSDSAVAPHPVLTISVKTFFRDS